MLPLQVCEYGYAYLFDCTDVLVNPQSAMTGPERTLPMVSQLLQMALQLDLLQLACATAQNTQALDCKHSKQAGTLTVTAQLFLSPTPLTHSLTQSCCCVWHFTVCPG